MDDAAPTRGRPGAGRWRAAARGIEGALRWRVAGSPRLRIQARRALKSFGGALGYAVFVEPRWLEVTHLEVEVRGLPAGLDGYRIAHVTDVHHNVISGRGYIERVVERTNALDADLVALTGDFITHNPARLEPCLAMLSRLRAPDGLLATRGNHDHRVPLHEMRAACEANGIQLLENEHVVIEPARERRRAGSNGPSTRGPLVVAGVADLWKGAPDPSRALAGAPRGMPRILLAHNPLTAELVDPRLEVLLQLSGHTHGGQVRPFERSIPSWAGKAEKYLSGMHEGPGCLVYTSRGVGASAFHARWNCRPEVALISLRAA